MTDTAIDVQGLSKRYRIGSAEKMHDTLGGALADMVTRPVKNLRHLRSLSSFRGDSNDSESIIWALKDVSFQVRRSEVVGIIGRNGAGKSTLLKILSRITDPTEGRVVTRGRMSSLLEVGTGFHPELTGRENVYLNGTILGMRRKEVERKFDAIVDFSGVEKFIDTPVKRYSSGMKMRLAFAVAAHLEPEILIVDEVLAVGDIAFQKKCLGKMDEVASEGRTVLLVSHNMDAIMGLCSRAIWLNSGALAADGPADSVTREYLTRTSTLNKTRATFEDFPDRRGDGLLRLRGFEIRDVDGNPAGSIASGDTVDFVLYYVSSGGSVSNVSTWIWVCDAFGRGLFTLGSRLTGDDLSLVPPRGELICRVPRFPLREGTYHIQLGLDVNSYATDRIIDGLKLEVTPGDFYGTGRSNPLGGGDFQLEHLWQLGEGVPISQDGITQKDRVKSMSGADL